MKTAPTVPAVAYSYLRFSSESQRQGNSIQRQTELRDAWLARSGATLDTSLRLRDEGKSAFTGEHRKNPDRHALAAFLQLVEKGRIPKGSYLVVENLDRLSREHIQPALILFLNLLQAGIRIVQLLPVEQVYDAESESMQLMMAIMELSRGNSESRMKSERIGRAWRNLKDKARTEKTPITPMVPAWLKVEGKKIVTIPERATIVKRMFREVIAGQGLIQIAKKLSSEGVPTFGKAKMWNPSSVYKVVHWKAAIGEYQPKTKKGKDTDGEAIPGYFPAVVTEAQWYAAQQALAGRREGGRRAVREFNPFQGLLFDARDGAKIYMTGPGGKANMTLVNRGAIRGIPGVPYVSFPLKAFSDSVLKHLDRLNAAEILGDDPGADELAELVGKRVDLEARIAKLQRELEDGDGEVKAAVNSLRKLETRLQDVVAAEAVARAKAASPLSTAIGDMQSNIRLASQLDNDETRARLKGTIRRVVAKVMCLFVPRGRARLAAVQVWFNDGPECRGYLIGYTQGRGNAQKKTPASWTSRTFLDLSPGKFDLRKPKDVAIIEKLLTMIEPDTLLIPSEKESPK